MKKHVTEKTEYVTQHIPVTHPVFLNGCGCDDVTEGMFGLSFSDDGRCKWQFVIDAVSARAVKITTFSWLDGADFSTESVSRQFITDSCILFDAHGPFVRAADYWGGHEDRINDRFIREPGK